MKKLVFILIIVLLCSCNGTHKWEYKIVKVAGKETEKMADFSPLKYADQTPMLNKMGEDGWELVNSYTETSTSFPNFGSGEYVIGLRDNTRTCVVSFIFKRPK